MSPILRRARRPRTRPGRRRRWTLRLGGLGLLLATLSITGAMERLFYYPSRGETPAPTGFPGAEVVRFASADGTRLRGWFIPAANDPSRVGPPPTVLHVHGNAGNLNDHLWFTEYLPPAGFNLFLFDYRGYGESEGRVWKRGGLTADTHAALDALLARPDVDPARVGVYGQSLGGSIALNLMADRDAIRAGVLEAAFTSWRDVACDTVDGLLPRFLARGLARALISDELRPDHAAGRIDRPMLFLHGTADPVVPFAHGRALAAAAGAEDALVAVEGGGHNDLRLVDPDLERRVIEFFRRALAAD